jgi:hypothetical protein
MNIPTNREQYLQETFPLPDGTTYIQNLDKHNKERLPPETIEDDSIVSDND